MLGHVPLFATPWTTAHQAPLCMGFSRQKYWSELPFPSPGDLLTQGSNLGLLHCGHILNYLSHQGNPESLIKLSNFSYSRGLFTTFFYFRHLLIIKKSLDTDPLSTSCIFNSLILVVLLNSKEIDLSQSPSGGCSSISRVLENILLVSLSSG